MKKNFYIIFSVIILLVGCGEVDNNNNSNNGIVIRPTATPKPSPTPQNSPTPTPIPTPTPTQIEDNNSSGIRIIGKITYDRVPVNKNGIGLDYNNIRKESAKLVTVKLVDGECYSDKIIAETSTNENGEYSFNNIEKNQNLRICVYSKMEKSEKYNIKVIDNTNSDAIYVIKSSLFNTDSSKRVNLHADSGWGGYSYTRPRQAAPFAILDSIYQAMQKVLSADPNAYFPKLKINWSIYNTPASSQRESAIREGLIGTTYFNGEDSLYILGDEDSDTDEYDDHIMIHEWAHYFEENFSRADSIGGPHGSGDRLDIRVAFGEGWANAFSAIATDNPIYFDTQGPRQSQGFAMDIESGPSGVKGYYSEDSIQHIIYDIYDSHDDGADKISMGFKPIYKELTTFQKNTKAFTSIFTFIVGLEEQNPAQINKIDALLRSEYIDHIDDIYGSNIDPKLYVDIYSNYICTTGIYGYENKLYNHIYVKYRIDEARDYDITVYQNNGSGSDPDFGVYRVSPFEQLGESKALKPNIEKDRYHLPAGEYLLDILEYNGLKNACFNVTIE